MFIFFNSSLPRSGSELLQVILSQNPSIYASPTSPLLEYQFAARQNFNLPEVQSQPEKLMVDAFISMCKNMAEGYYTPITDRPFVIDKNRGWLHYYEWVNQWCPNPKMICMVRDLRDIIASMEKIFRQNRHTPSGPDNPSKMLNLTIYERTKYWLHSQPVGLALQRTFDAIQRGIASNILFVRYEDLCSNPSLVLEQVYNYLEIDGFIHDFSNIEKSVVENDRVFGPYGGHSVRSKLNGSSDWKSILNEEIGAYIVNEHRWFFDAFYKG